MEAGQVRAAAHLGDDSRILADLRPTDGSPLPRAWRSFRTAIGLGWAVESNWSDPFLFAIYTIAKPLAAALILVRSVMVIPPRESAAPGSGRPR